MTSKLSDSQLVILSTACQREHRSVYPITAKLTGGALSKVVTSLLAKALIEEIPAQRDEQVWRSDADDARFTLRATPAACEALGIEASASARPAGNEPGGASQSRRTRRGKAGATGGNKPRRCHKPSAAAQPQDGSSAAGIRTGTKQALLIDMLR